MHFCIHSGHGDVVKELFGVTPIFLNGGENLTKVPMMFINSGKGSDLTTLLGVTSRTSVLSSII